MQNLFKGEHEKELTDTTSVTAALDFVAGPEQVTEELV